MAVNRMGQNNSPGGLPDMRGADLHQIAAMRQQQAMDMLSSRASIAMAIFQQRASAMPREGGLKGFQERWSEKAVRNQFIIAFKMADYFGELATAPLIALQKQQEAQAEVKPKIERE